MKKIVPKYTRSPSWTPLPLPCPHHSSVSSQCTSPKHPVSFIKPGLVIHFIYDIKHVSVTLSQIIPPSPSPTESKRLSYTSASLLLSPLQGYHYHFSKYHIWNESPVRIQCTILGVWGWCTGTTQRVGTGRVEGRGFRMGSTCTRGRFMLMYGKTNTIL